MGISGHTSRTSAIYGVRQSKRLIIAGMNTVKGVELAKTRSQRTNSAKTDENKAKQTNKNILTGKEYVFLGRKGKEIIEREEEVLGIW